jgi:hypothetical protein
MDESLSGYIEEAPLQTSIADIDGDGFPDIVISNDNLVTTFYLNRINVPDTVWHNGTDTVKLCAGADTALLSDFSGSIYKWQQDTGSGFYDIADNGSISGSATATLHLINVPASWEGYTYRCITDNLNVSRSFVLSVDAPGASSVSIAATDTLACALQQVTFTATPVNGGASPQYKWIVNGNTVGETSNTLVVNSWNTTNTMVQVVMTPNTKCAVSGTIASNTVTVKRREPDTITAIIAGMTSVMKGQSAFITATVNSTMPPLTYQWQDSTSVHTWKDMAGSTAATIDYIPDSTGSAIRCKIIANAACGAVYALSNELIFIVNSQLAVSSNAVMTNPVTSGMLAIDSLDQSANWQSLEIINYQNGKREFVQNISGPASLNVYVGNLSKGIYLVVLRNRAGDALRLKFVKL